MHYMRGLPRSGLAGVLALHYAAVIVLTLSIWPMVMSGENPHPDILLKVVGAYCFLVATVAIPLVATILFPPIGETDSAFQVTLLRKNMVFDARMVAVVTLSALAALPLLPLFLASNPAYGAPLDGCDVFPFLQAVATGAWVHLIMEMVCRGETEPGRLGRRLAVIAGFILLHVTIVGLLASVYFSTLQEHQWIKLLINLNPFSQLYILMEGSNKQWLLVKNPLFTILNYSPIASLVRHGPDRVTVDFRLWLFILQGIVLALTLLIYRTFLRSSDGSTRAHP